MASVETPFTPEQLKVYLEIRAAKIEAEREAVAKNLNVATDNHKKEWATARNLEFGMGRAR